MAYKKYEYFKLNFNYETATEFIEKSSGYKFQYEGITFFIEKYGEKCQHIQQQRKKAA